MADTNDVYDVIVVGAGIEGSATAYHLAKAGKQTLLIEQFPLPHNRGSSHGQSRITRKAYGPKDFYTEMMKESYALTDELERECGEQLFINCGCLVFGERDDPFVTGSDASLKRHGVPHETFGVQEQKRRYPGMACPDTFGFVLDKSGGLLKADKMLQAFQRQFVRYGGTVRDGEPMVDLYPGDIVSIRTSKSVLRGKSVVLALGPWAAKFLPRFGVNIPLENTAGPDMYDVNNYPAFFTVTAAGKEHVYGLPACEYPGLVKICLHTGPVIDADRRDDVNNQWSLDRIKHVIATHFPTLEKDPKIVETCIYTNTPDLNPVLDHHPTWKNVIIAAGFSGHGFKLSPIVGKLLGQLATGQKPSYDMAPFKLNRFFKNKL